LLGIKALGKLLCTGFYETEARQFPSCAAKSAEIEFALSETGIPIVTPKLTFGKGDEPDTVGKREVPHEQALRLLDVCLAELSCKIWIIMDRLDEAFQGFLASKSQPCGHSFVHI
jgi:hypothetical protein